MSVRYISELYGCQSSNSGELDHIPKQCQFAISGELDHIPKQCQFAIQSYSLQLFSPVNRYMGELDHIPKQCQFAIFQSYMVVSLVTRESWITFLNSVSLLYFRVIWLSV